MSTIPESLSLVPGIFTDKGDKAATTQILDYILLSLADDLIKLLHITGTNRDYHSAIDGQLKQ